MRIALPAAAVAIGVLALSHAVEAACPSTFKTISSCGNVTTNVCLGADISTSTGDCLKVRASGVTVDGNGRRIGAPGFAVSWVDHSRITLRGVVSARGVQIYGANANRNVVENSDVGSVGIYMGDDNVVRNSKLKSLDVQGLNNNPPLRTVVTGNTIEGTSGNVVHISPGGDGKTACVRSDFRIENNLIRGTAAGAADQALLYLRCGTHNIIVGNTLRATGRARGIYLRDQADDNLIQDNLVWINRGDRGAIHFSSGNVDKRHPRNNTIDRNVFRADAARSIWIQSNDFRNNAFTRNLFWSNSPEGARIAGGANNVFDHNTFYNVTLLGPVLVIQQTTPPGNTYTNNILVSTSPSPLIVTSGVFDVRGYHADYNVFFWAGAELNGPVGLAVLQAVTGAEAHSIVADPRFVNPSAGDFRLRPGSPALTADSNGGPAGAFGPAS